MKSSSKKYLFIAGILIVAIVVAFFAFLFLTNDNPNTTQNQSTLNQKVPKGAVLIVPKEHKSHFYTPLDKYCESSFDDCEAETVVKNGKKFVEESNQYITGFTAKYNNGKKVNVTFPKSRKDIHATELRGSQIYFYDDELKERTQFLFDANDIDAQYKTKTLPSDDEDNWDDIHKTYNPSRTLYVREDSGSHTSTVFNSKNERVAEIKDSDNFYLNGIWIDDQTIAYGTDSEVSGLVILNLTTHESQSATTKELNDSSNKKYNGDPNLYDVSTQNPYESNPVDGALINGKYYVLFMEDGFYMHGKPQMSVALANVTDKKEVWRKIVPLKGDRVKSVYFTDDLRGVVANIDGRMKESVYQKHTALFYDDSSGEVTYFNDSFLFPISDK